jgi:hypothetical protein
MGTFDDWWATLPDSEKTILGEINCKKVWEAAQKATLATLEDALTAQKAYDAGYREARAKYKLYVGAYCLLPGQDSEFVWITNSSGEGGAFPAHELATVIHQFYAERF